MKLMIRILMVLVSVVLLQIPVTPAFAAGQATFVLPSENVSVKKGETFLVHISVAPQGEAINTGRLALQYDATLLQVDQFILGDAFPQVAPQNRIDNEKGYLYEGAFRVKDTLTNTALFGTVVFRSIAEGKSTISLAPESRLIGEGISKGIDPQRGTVDVAVSSETVAYPFSITDVTTGEPVISVFSPTHENTLLWYASDTVKIQWSVTDDQNIQQFYYAFDAEPDTKPEQPLSSKIREKTFAQADEGVNYFHLQAELEDGTRTDVIHFPVRIDISAPNPVVPVLENQQLAIGEDALLRFGTTDFYAGISYYTVVIDDEDLGIQESPLRIQSPERGVHQVVVIAVDMAGNMIGGQTAFAVMEDVSTADVTTGGAMNYLLYGGAILGIILISILFKKLIIKK